MVKKIINNDPILLKDSMSLEDYLNLLSKDHFIYDTMLVESDFLDDNLRFFQPADICFSFSNDDTSYFDLRIKFPDNILDSVNYFYMEESDRIRFLLNRKDYAKHLALINVKTYSNAYKYMKHEYNNKLYFTPNKLEKNRIISIIERYFNKYKLNE